MSIQSVLYSNKCVKNKDICDNYQYESIAHDTHVLPTQQIFCTLRGPFEYNFRYEQTKVTSTRHPHQKGSESHASLTRPKSANRDQRFIRNVTLQVAASS